MSKPTLPKVAKPRYAAAWDTWNSSSTGHQRPEIQPGTGWREVRAVKLTSQFQAGGSGGQRLLHTNPFFKYGDEDENCGEGVNGKSVVDMLRNPGVMQETLGLSGSTQAATQETKIANSDQPLKGIFTGLTIYINGSTFPLVSDHKLKMLLSEHGANMAMHLGRRRVTHVILGRPSGRGLGGGGGLAGGKLDKEIRKIGGCGIKFVGVEWYFFACF